MNLEVLVSTMHNKDASLIKRMNIQTDAIIINQGECEGDKTILNNNFIIRWFDTKDRGLSRSRNRAIDEATGDICLLADDDLIYVDNYEDKILHYFRKYPKVDIMAFQVEGIEEKFKKYHEKERSINYLTSMKISSVEVAFRLDCIKRNHLKFNELFGAGSKYLSGEENIFLKEALRKGLSIRYVPIKIADLHMGNSTWFKGYNNEFFISKGASLTALSTLFSIPFILQFAIRKFSIYKESQSFLKVVKLMLLGRKNYMMMRSK